MNIAIVNFHDETTIKRFKKAIDPQYNVIVFSFDEPLLINKIKLLRPIGIILTGSPLRIGNKNHAKMHPEIMKLGIPVLGICYGYQNLVISHFGEESVVSGEDLLYRKIRLKLEKPFLLPKLQYQLNHYDDSMIKLPRNGWKSIETECFDTQKYIHRDGEIFGMYHEKKRHLGIIFHPEYFPYKTGRIFFSAWINWILHKL